LCLVLESCYSSATMRLAPNVVSSRSLRVRLAVTAITTGILSSGCLQKLDDLGVKPVPTQSTINPANPAFSTGEVTEGGAASISPTGWQTTAEHFGSDVIGDAALDRTCPNCGPDAGDRAIGPVSSGEVDSEPATPQCTSGNYIGRADGGSSDCRPCEPGTFSFDDDAESCVPHGRCEAGTFTIMAGTAERDVVCAGCPSGYFASEPGRDVCVKWRDCEPGQFVKELGSSIADRLCEDCADGETSVVSNAGACTAADECGAGFVQISPAGGGEGPECEPCFAGAFCAGGDAAAVVCTSGTWDNDGNAATPCVEKTSCLAGKYVVDAGSTTADRSCGDCEGGYSETSNAAACNDWTVCQRGQYVVTPGTALVDRACSDCDDGTFTDEDNATACAVWSTCRAPGAYETAAPSAEGDRGCGECKVPELALEDNASACVVVAFQMVSGQVAMEAEHFHATSSEASEDHLWQELELTGTSGGRCLELTPDVDATWLNSPATTAPKLEYSVNFTQTGTFYIHVRGDTGAKTIGTSDSCFAGVDGAATSAFMFSNVSGAWGWLTQPTSVTTTGVHVVQIFGREDGFRVDKIVVSTSNVPPTGDGPTESAQQ
jgi:hypothetical protein